MTKNYNYQGANFIRTTNAKQVEDQSLNRAATNKFAGLGGSMQKSGGKPKVAKATRMSRRPV